MVTLPRWEGIDMRLTPIAICAALMLACGGPAAPPDPPSWHKGVTHIHSLWSDGDDAPEMIAAWYRERGYDFIAFSEHNTLQQNDKFVPVAEDARLKPARVDEIRRRFGADWVTTRTTDGITQMRLKTHDELRSRFDARDEFLIMPGEEITSGNRGPHVNALNLREPIQGETGGSRTELIQKYIDAVRAQSERNNVPMLAHVNHVNFADGVTTEELVGVRGLEFFEVFNGHHDVHNWGNPDKGMPPTEVHWDVIQSLKLLEDPGYRLFGVSTDDSHHYLDWRIGRANPGRGWVMVKAARLDTALLIEAMKRGDFYGTTGVVLKDVIQTAEALALEIDGQDGVTYTTQFIGTRRGFATTSEAVTDSRGAPLPRASRRYSDDIGAVLQQSTDLAPRYVFKGDELYVRARVVSSRLQPNPFAEGDREIAWTQPVLVGR
jgi:hypothetical protein